MFLVFTGVSGTTAEEGLFDGAPDASAKLGDGISHGRVTLQTPPGWRQPFILSGATWLASPDGAAVVLVYTSDTDKVRFDAFVGTNLDLLLRGNKIDTILLGGVATNFGVESTARTARELNYNVVVLTDCCLNVAQEQHEFTVKHILPRFARIMTSEQALGLLE